MSQVKKLLEDGEKRSEAEWRRKSLLKESKKAERDLENVKTAICSGFLSDTVKALLTDTEKRKKDIESKLVEVNSEKKKERIKINAGIIKKYTSNLLATLELNPVLGKTFLMRYFNELYCTKVGDCWQISFDSPLINKKLG